MLNKSAAETSASSRSGSRRGISNINRPISLRNDRKPLGAYYLKPVKRAAQIYTSELTPCKNVHEKCGHKCGGVVQEKTCLPCLEPACQTQNNARANKDDLCNICYTSELGSDPAVKLGCGHIFHAQCVRDLFKHKWSTLRISFDFLACPACKSSINRLNQYPQLQDDLSKLLKLKE